jgi:hypothetical protein
MVSYSQGIVIFVAVHESAVGPKRTHSSATVAAAFGGKAAASLIRSRGSFGPKADTNGSGGSASGVASYLRPFGQYANGRVIWRMSYQTLGGDNGGNT